MDRDRVQRLLRALGRARTEIERARAENWKLFSGESAERLLTTLEAQVNNAEKTVESDGAINPAEFRGLVRWVTDWIPDTSDPLVDAAAELEKSAAD